MTGSPLWPREDVLPRRHAVLGGISPGYPSVTARLHTCYSPVRRSPAATSKLAAPLPLDLHVLSLSLAFILSQDQTLRCCYIVLLSFEIGWRPRGPLDNRSACVRPGLPVVSESTGSFFSSCTTSSIAILSMSYLLSLPGLRRKSSAKLRRIFELAKFFGVFFELFNSRRRFHLLGPSRDLRPEKRVQSYAFLPDWPNFSATFFRLFFRRDGDAGQRRLEDRGLGHGRRGRGKRGGGEEWRG